MTKAIVFAGFLIIVFIAGGVPCTAKAASPEPIGCPPLSLAPLALPPGPEGEPYTYNVPAYGGVQPVNLTFIAGSLPPGLVMSSAGEVTGIPRASGTFDFTVTATDSCPTGIQRVSRPLRMVITGNGGSVAQPSVVKQQQLRLKITATPATISLLTGSAAVQEVSYLIEAQPPHTASLSSPGGTFSVAGSVVESVPVPLTITVVNGVAKVTENIIVPARVLQAARREKAGIIYSRPFSGRQATALAIVEFSHDQ